MSKKCKDSDTTFSSPDDDNNLLNHDDDNKVMFSDETVPVLDIEAKPVNQRTKQCQIKQSCTKNTNYYESLSNLDHSDDDCEEVYNDDDYTN